MKYFLLLCAAISSFFSGAQAQQNDHNKSLLWKITGRDGKASYLFGTMHMLCSNDYIWTDAMKKSLDASDAVCFEMDMDDPNVAMQGVLGLMDTTGKKLSDYFTTEQYALLKAYMRDSLQTDIAMFEQMKPFVLQTLFVPASGNCDSTVSYEENIMQDAKAAGKEIVGIESIQEQLALVDKIPADSIVKEIIEGLEHPSHDEGEYEQLMNAYKKQDLPALHHIIQATRTIGELQGPLLDERNQKWISRMGTLMKDRSIFFAVGAGHLWGDQGVITLLRKQGYTVTAVK